MLNESTYNKLLNDISNIVYTVLSEELNMSDDDIIDYILNGDVNEANEQTTVLQRLKNVAKKGILTTAILMAVLPSLSAQDQVKAIDIADNAGVKVENFQEDKKEKEDIVLYSTGASFNQNDAKQKAMYRMKDEKKYYYENVGNDKLMYQDVQVVKEPNGRYFCTVRVSNKPLK